MPPRRSTQGVRHQSPSPGPQAVRPQVPDISGGRTHRSYHCAGAGWVLRMSGGQGRSDAAGRWGGRCGRPSPSHGSFLGPELGHTWAHVVTVTLTRRTRGPLLAGGPAGCTQDLLPWGGRHRVTRGQKGGAFILGFPPPGLRGSSVPAWSPPVAKTWARERPVGPPRPGCPRQSTGQGGGWRESCPHADSHGGWGPWPPEGHGHIFPGNSVRGSGTCGYFFSKSAQRPNYRTWSSWVQFPQML